MTMSDQILDVDLLAFENGDASRRRAVVDGVRRSLETGFVYTSSDLSEDLLDTAYGMLREFFSMDQDTKRRFVAPGAHGQTGYTGLLVETAASSDKPDWKEMLNWASPIPAGHPLRRRNFSLMPWCPVSPRCCTRSTTRSPICSDVSFV
jgi:isopenicillin N synthase-like dioxygenase